MIEADCRYLVKVVFRYLSILALGIWDKKVLPCIKKRTLSTILMCFLSQLNVHKELSEVMRLEISMV